jgi:hypothetical protein
MFFKLLAGRHKQGGKEYGKGDIVETDVNLVALFGNMFVAVGEEKATSAPVEKPSIPLPKEVLKGKKAAAVKKETAPAASPQKPSIPLAKEEEEEEVVATEQTSEQIEAALVKKYGRNVTGNYQKAIEIGLQVYVAGNGNNKTYSVLDIGTQEVVNKKKLSTKAETADFLDVFAETTADTEEV